MKSLRVGARGSPLAVWQAERAQAALHAVGQPTELVTLATAGDLDRNTPLARFGRPAVFSGELDNALLENRIDLAVHSLKDLPTELPDGLEIAAVSVREDPRDALVGRGPLTWASLRRNATVATSSLRRQAQLKRARPDLQVADLRGNVGTRLQHLDQAPQWDGVLLAVAGLVRLGLSHRIGERLPLDLMLPAPGQGALGLTIRTGDGDLRELVRRAMNDGAVELAVTAERSLLAAVEGGCHAPVAAYGQMDPAIPGRLRLRARVVSLDGRQVAEGHVSETAFTVSQAAALGVRLAAQLTARGADHIIGQARTAASGPTP